MSDLQEIRRRIYEEEKVEELLQYMGCQHIKKVNHRYEAQLPEKFGSNNRRSVQVYYQSEYLPCRIRSRGMTGSIFDLVSYIVFDCVTQEEIRKCLPRSKRWICEKLGYEIHNGNIFTAEEKEDPLAWLKKVRGQRKRKQLRYYENKIYDESILNQYIMFPHYLYLQEGLNYKTQLEFQIGYDVQSERIIFPIHNQFGEIVSIKGRTTDPDYKEKGIYKFIYLYPFNKQIEWFNWHRGLFYILEKKEVIIFEAEKSCMFATQWGYRNCLAIGGDDISEYQVEMIKKLGIDIKIVLAFDKDKTPNEIKEQAKKFGNTREVFALWDKDNLLSKELKHSPVDLGKEIFEKLYSNYIKYKISV